MNLSCQKHLFSLDEEVHYLNCAYMSPLLKSVEEAGISGILKKRNPAEIKPQDFFTEAPPVKKSFGQLVNAPEAQIAVIPSVSYGMATVVQNLRSQPKQEVISIHEEFPSAVYSLQAACAEKGLKLRLIAPPTSGEDRARKWNMAILEAITPNTAVVALSSVHWADGTRFDLEAIGKHAKEVGAAFVVDGTQSVGAMPIDVQRYQIDALICAGYKWLLGPYSIGLAYYGEYFNDGKPLEESWINRMNSENFSRLVAYEPNYRSGAARYNVGESSNFILLPMLGAALQQLLAWGPENVQAYCKQLTAPLIAFIQTTDCWVEQEAWRGQHLFGIQLPAGASPDQLLQHLSEQKVIVSVRGQSLRISPHVYNTPDDISALISALKANLK